MLVGLFAAIGNYTYAAENDDIWGKGRFLRIGYANVQTGDGMNPVEKNKFGFFLTKGTSYLFPKQPIAGLLKVGVDAVWLDMQLSKYKSPYANTVWTSEFEYDNDYKYDDEGGSGMDILDKLAGNVGHMSMTFAMGVGPVVTVAPFALSKVNIMKPLKASVYFHYCPTMGMYARMDSGDMEMATGFCNMMDFGFNLTYRAIGVGVEGHWGKGKFKPLDFESLLGDADDSVGSSRYKRSFANTRVYLQVRF